MNVHLAIKSLITFIFRELNLKKQMVVYYNLSIIGNVGVAVEKSEFGVWSCSFKWKL